MQRWEYEVGSIGVDASGERIREELNSFGDDGWELVSEVVHGEHWCWTFKRPKESE